MNKFLKEVSEELEKRQVKSETILYVIDKLKQSFKTGAWVQRQQAAKKYPVLKAKPREQLT